METQINRIQRIVSSSKNLKEKIVADIHLLSSLSQLADKIVEVLQSGGKIWFCGNGGSAADAQHLAAELSGRFYFDRKPLAAEALHVNTSYLTAVANDYSYNDIYSRYLEGAGSKGDLIIGISTSGNSENVLRALQVAVSKEIITASFTGSSGGKMANTSDYLINIPSDDTPRIQECHILLGHILCELVEEKMFK